MHGGVGALALALAIRASNGVYGVWVCPLQIPIDGNLFRVVWLRLLVRDVDFETNIFALHCMSMDGKKTQIRAAYVPIRLHLCIFANLNPQNKTRRDEGHRHNFFSPNVPMRFLKI